MWDNIKYIFQIPLAWFKKIHDRVFNAYGVNFIVVKDGYYGGAEIGIDEGAFSDAVNQAVDLSSLSGAVKSVDNILPDANGNIDLSGSYVTLNTNQTITGQKTFSQSINLSSYGGLESDADYVRLAYGSTNGITIFGSDTTRQQLLDDEPARLYSTGADNQIATRGYCRLNFARASTLSGFVKTVNNVGPDPNGNVSVEIPDLPDNIVTTVNGQTGDVVLGNIVNSVNGIAPVNGDVQLPEISGITIKDVADYLTDNNYQTQTDVTSYVQNEIQDFVTNTDVTSYVAQELQNYALTSDLTEYAHTVDGIQAVDGIVNFNLSPNKWMKTDSQGHLATTNSQPIELSTGNTGYLYANNGSLEFKQDEYVTLSTDQTITGKKKFTQNDVTIVDNSLLVVDTSLTGNGTSVSKNGLTINSSTPFIDFSTPGTAANDSFIAMTAASGNRLGIDSPHGIDLKAPVNQAKLANQPTDTSTNSLAIATCGYVNSRLSGVTNNAFKVVTNVTWNGTQIVIASSNLNIQNGVIKRITANANTTINTVAYAP